MLRRDCYLLTGNSGQSRIGCSTREDLQQRAGLDATVGKIRVQEMTAAAGRGASPFREAKGSEAGLRMEAETLAGSGPQGAERTVYPLTAAAGWRR